MIGGRTFFYAGIGAALVFGWLIFPSLIFKNVRQPVQFSHASHTGDNVGMTCSDCHSFDSEGRNYSIPGNKECVSCHSESMGVSPAEEEMVDKYLKTGIEIPWLEYSRQPENVNFSHSVHVKLAGIECRRCHFTHQYTRELRPLRVNRISGYSLDVLGRSLMNVPSTNSRGMRMDDCIECHRSRGFEKSCIDCHK